MGGEDDRGSALSRQAEFWKAALEGLPEEVVLPADRPRPAVPSYRGGLVQFHVDAGLHSRLRALGRERGATLFMVVQAGLAALLSRLGAGCDIPIGAPVAGRADAALDELVGFFVNTLVLRADVSGDPTFAELLARVRETDLAAYAHQDIPFESVVKIVSPVRSAWNPLFQVMLSVEADEAGMTLPGVRAVAEGVDPGVAKFDLAFSFREQRPGEEEQGGLAGVIEYMADLFDEDSVEMLAGRLVRLLDAAAADPDARVGQLEIFLPGERNLTLQQWNDTAAKIPAATLPDLFEDQAARTPNAIAVTCAGRQLTYRELDDQANRLACYLANRGVCPEQIVAIALPRTELMIVALLGVLKAGGAFLPVDPYYPAERIAFMLSRRPAQAPAHGHRDQPTSAHW